MPIALAALLLMAPTAPPTPDDFLDQYVATRRFAAGRPAAARLTPDGTAAVFLRSGPRDADQALYVTDLATGGTRRLATAGELAGGAAATLTAEERAQLERQRITARGITAFHLSRDGERIAVAAGGRLFLLERRSGAVKALRTSGRPLDPTFSPDGRTLSYVVDHDLRLLDLAANRERRLTRGGTEDVTHGTAEFIAQEELARFEGHWWAPDSRRLLYQETDQRAVERFTLHDPLHPERPATVVRYPRAGGNNAVVRLGVISARGGKTTWLEWDREAFPYVGQVAWPERGPLSIVVLDRRQQVKRLLAADPRTGRTRVLVEERDARWVEPHARFPRWLPDGTGFFWLTERHGAAELELRGPDGALRESWVAPGQGFEEWVGWDPARRWLWFTGGPNPTESHLYVVKRPGAPEPWRPGEGPGLTTASLSRDGRVLLVRGGDFGGPRPVEAWQAGGPRLAVLPSVAEEPPFATRGEIRRVGPGEGLYALLIRPRHEAPGARLPVLVHVYGGPGAQMVRAASVPLLQWIADQGFAVVSVDNRGTPGRGVAFSRAIRGDFAGPALEDQVEGLRALAAEVPELDLSRVGIWGGSFGGYMAALGVLRRPDVYRAAVAEAPVVDWRDYDTAYTERYLGLPGEIPGAYERSSLLGDAAGLSRPLLLVHGTADDNVWLFHSLKLSQALFRAGRPHELLLLPGAAHGMFSSQDPVLVRRGLETVVAFFREHLLPGAGGPPARTGGDTARRVR